MATTGSHQTRALLLAVAALLALPFAGGQQQVSATQKPTGPQLLKPGDSMKLQCSTESDSNSLMWYRHRRPDTGRATGLDLLSFSYTSTSDTELKDAPPDVRDRIESVRTRAELSLTVKDLRPADSAWYYCAARDNNAVPAYFGSGTRLIVTEGEDSAPSVSLLPPSCRELRDRQRLTLVCIVTDFYPEAIGVVWRIGSKVIDKGTHLAEPIRNAAGGSARLFSTTARLTVPEKVWLRGGTFSCEVQHRSLSQPVVRSITAPENFIWPTLNVTKLSFILMLCKSLMYCCLINILQGARLWRKSL